MVELLQRLGESPGVLAEEMGWPEEAVRAAADARQAMPTDQHGMDDMFEEQILSGQGARFKGPYVKMCRWSAYGSVAAISSSGHRSAVSSSTVSRDRRGGAAATVLLASGSPTWRRSNTMTDDALRGMPSYGS